MTGVIPTTDISQDVLAFLVEVGVRLTREYEWVTGGPYAKDDSWVLPVGDPATVKLVVAHVAESDGTEVQNCYRWILRTPERDQVLGTGRWHPAEHTTRYWDEFETKVREHLLHAAIAALARLTRCAGCGWQEAECHIKQVRERMQVCCFNCRHPLTLRRRDT